LSSVRLVALDGVLQVIRVVGVAHVEVELGLQLEQRPRRLGRM
jgi:hypothetical protein